mgnify:CR=1 FL=1
MLFEELAGGLAERIGRAGRFREDVANHGDGGGLCGVWRRRRDLLDGAWLMLFVAVRPLFRGDGAATGRRSMFQEDSVRFARSCATDDRFAMSRRHAQGWPVARFAIWLVVQSAESARPKRKRPALSGPF